jgi:hypothetical protein
MLKVVNAPPLMPCAPLPPFETSGPTPSISQIPHSPSASKTITAFPAITHLASTIDFLPKFPIEGAAVVVVGSDLLLWKLAYNVNNHNPCWFPDAVKLGFSDEMDIWSG